MTQRQKVSNRHENFPANSPQLALSSLCMFHGQSYGIHLPAEAAGGVHAASVNQDYPAEQVLDMAMLNPL